MAGAGPCHRRAHLRTTATARTLRPDRRQPWLLCTNADHSGPGPRSGRRRHPVWRSTPHVGRRRHRWRRPTRAPVRSTRQCGPVGRLSHTAGSSSNSASTVVRIPFEHTLTIEIVNYSTRKSRRSSTSASFCQASTVDDIDRLRRRSRTSGRAHRPDRQPRTELCRHRRRRRADVDGRRTRPRGRHDRLRARPGVGAAPSGSRRPRRARRCARARRRRDDPTCAVCGNPIALARLLAVPGART